MALAGLPGSRQQRAPLPPALRPPGPPAADLARFPLEVVPHGICDVTGLRSVTDYGFRNAQIQKIMKTFEDQCRLRTWDARYWQTYPFKGVYQYISSRAHYNRKSCHSNLQTYWELLDSRAMPWNDASEHEQWWMKSYQLIPTIVFGQANHSLRLPKGSVPGDFQPGAQWWPHQINCWVTPTIDHSIRLPGCHPGLCGDNAITGSRPWLIHRTRILVLTDAMWTEYTAPSSTPSDFGFQMVSPAVELNPSPLIEEISDDANESEDEGFCLMDMD